MKKQPEKVVRNGREYRRQPDGRYVANDGSVLDGAVLAGLLEAVGESVGDAVGAGFDALFD